MSRLDYFVVGREIALETRTHLGGDGPPRLDLSVLAPPDRELGWVRTELLGDHVLVQLHWSELDAAERHEAEVIRLVARVVTKLVGVELRIAPGPTGGTSADALIADGFRRHSEGRWYLPPMALVAPAAPARDMDALYADPCNVVWNFEPRPWDTLASLLVEASKREQARVLDVGCGFGKNARLLAGLGVDAYGVDVASAAIEQCRRWVRHPDRFVAASLERLPHDDASFDAVLDVGCLHCLPPELVAPGIAEIARVLKPGGWLFSRVLLPRDRPWLDAQSYRVARLGIDPPALARWLAPDFEVGLTTDDEATQLRARRRG